MLPSVNEAGMAGMIEAINDQIANDVVIALFAYIIRKIIVHRPIVVILDM